MKTAADFHDSVGNADYANYLRSNTTLFTKAVVQNSGPFVIPSGDSYERTIAGLNERNAELETRLTEVQTDYSSLLEYNNSIRGKTMIDPQTIASFTDVMRDKFTRMMTALSNDDEDTYVMSIADPFHPSA